MYYVLKTYRHRILWAILIPALCSIFFSFAALSVPMSLISQYEEFFTYCNDPLTPSAMIIMVLVYLVFLCCLTGVFTDDMQIHVTYCFTRKKNIYRWLFSSIVFLAFLSFLAIFSYTICGNLVICIAKHISFQEFISEFSSLLKIVFLLWLFVFSMSLLINVFSLIFKKKYVLVLSISFLVVLAACIPFIIKSENKILYWMNPVIRMNFTLHSDIAPEYFEEFFFGNLDPSIFHMKFLTSILYFLILIVIAVIIGIFVVKKTDIALKEE